MKRYFRDIDDTNEGGFSLIADFEGSKESLFDVEIDDTLLVLSLRNMVLFPGVVLPISVGRKSSLNVVHEA
ncbi:MAG: LON peptidase substrate-binding domain-containing protein [Bacteroides sp.]|nr:LON peptidase substrate-binding domain-containing protein [Bacteroides sp.]